MNQEAYSGDDQQEQSTQSIHLKGKRNFKITGIDKIKKFYDN